MILIEIREGRFYFDGVARVLHAHVLHFSLANENPFRGSRVVKSRNRFRDFLDIGTWRGVTLRAPHPLIFINNSNSR
jgi:hypothetical protein